MTEFIKACRNWQRDNWSEFIGQTGGNCVLGLTTQEYREMCKGCTALPESIDALSEPAMAPKGKTSGQSALDAAGNAAVSVGLAATGTAAGDTLPLVLSSALGGAGIPGLVFGSLVNAGWSIISGLLFGEPTDSVLKATRATSASLLTMVNRLDAASDAATSEWASKRATITGSIVNATSTGALERIEELITSTQGSLEVPSKSLARQLLARWVEQHSATPDEQNDDTDAESWADAKEAATAGSGGKPRSDLFIQQCRYMWALHGLDVKAGVAELEGIYRPIASLKPERIVEILRPLLKLRPAPAVIHPEMLASTSDAYDAETLKQATLEKTYALKYGVALSHVEGSIVLTSMAFQLTPKPGLEAVSDDGGELCLSERAKKGNKSRVQRWSWSRETGA